MRVSVLILAAVAVASPSSQAPMATKVVAEARAALGGEAALSAVRTLTLDGHLTPIGSDGSPRQAAPVSIAVELPDKYIRRDHLGNLNGTPIARTLGFNGATPIEIMDAPRPTGGQQMFVRRGGQPMSVSAPPDAASQAAAVAGARRDFARLLLGALVSGSTAFPVTFGATSEAESGGVRAHIMAVTGPDGFEGRLFVDATTHVPLFFSWMDKEPLVVPPPERPVTFSGGLTAEQAAELRRERDERVKKAEAARRVVEYRLFYANYEPRGAIRLPTRLQQMIDGRVTEEITFDRIEVNPSIDPDRFRSRR